MPASDRLKQLNPQKLEPLLHSGDRDRQFDESVADLAGQLPSMAICGTGPYSCVYTLYAQLYIAHRV